MNDSENIYQRFVGTCSIHL